MTTLHHERPRRRRVTAAAALGLALVLAGPGAGAQEEGWGAEYVPSGGTATSITGQVVIRPPADVTSSEVRVTVLPADATLAERCATALPAAAAAGAAPGAPAEVTVTATPRCNGPSVVDVVGSGTAVDGSARFSGVVRAGGSFDVALKAPPVAGLVATPIEGGGTQVRWSAPAEWADGAPPDFADAGIEGVGYVVLRSVAGGPFEEVGRTAPDVTALDLPAPEGASGDVRVQVVARRGDGRGGVVPDDLSTAAPVAVATAVAPRPPSPPGGGGRGNVTRFDPPSVQLPSMGAAAAGPTGATGGGGAGSPGNGDAPFDGELPFGDPDVEPGEEEAVLPGDADRFLVTDTPSGGDGLLVPAAVAIHLGVVALHVRYLARRAAALA